MKQRKERKKKKKGSRKGREKKDMFEQRGKNRKTATVKSKPSIIPREKTKKNQRKIDALYFFPLFMFEFA